MRNEEFHPPTRQPGRLPLNFEPKGAGWAGGSVIPYSRIAVWPESNAKHGTIGA
jgi:hypothetical protein